jgi:CrcB protein
MQTSVTTVSPMRPVAPRQPLCFESGVPRTILVGLGGLVGSLARYWLAGVMQRLNGMDFPVGTLTVNVLGSFVVGVVMVLSLERGLLNADMRLLLAVGLCGGFTTMSTFSYETMALLRDGEMALAFSNLSVTLGLCFLAVWLGGLVGRLL